MSFHVTQPILFKHCDPAKLLFYPRWYEIANDVVETFFDALGAPFHVLHPQSAVPTVRIETEFVAPTRHGDVLEIALDVAALGRTSATLRFAAHCGEEARVRMGSTIVHVGETGRPVPWPAALRAELARYEGES